MHSSPEFRLVPASLIPLHIIRRWGRLLFIVSCILVLWAMFRPEPPPQPFKHSDKLGHVAAFFILAVTGRISFPRLPGTGFWIASLLLAWGLEYFQGALLPLRLFSLADAAANALGTGLAAGVWLWLRTILFRRE